VQSKADLLKKIRDGQLRYSELNTDQESFNEYAKAAVVTGHSARRYAVAAKPFELRYTLTFVKIGTRLESRCLPHHGFFTGHGAAAAGSTWLSTRCQVADSERG